MYQFLNSYGPTSELAYGQVLMDAGFFSSTAARFVLGAGIILALSVILVYVIRKFRGMALGRDDVSIMDHLQDFRQMRAEGQIDEKDYRRLKSQLSKQALEETIKQKKPGPTETRLSGDPGPKTDTEPTSESAPDDEMPDFKPEE